MIPFLSSVGQGVDGRTLFIQAVAFLMLAWVLKRFALPHLRKALTGRTASIRETYENAERETAKASTALEDVKNKLARIDEEARRRREAILEEARHLRESLLAEAAAQVRAEQEKVKSGIGMSRDHALLEVRLEVIRLILARVERVIAESMNESMNNRLVDRYLRHLDAIPSASDKVGVVK